MLTRPLIAALLSILLLIGGLNQGLGDVASGALESSATNAVDCDGMTYPGTETANTSGMKHSGISVDCDDTEQEPCGLSAPHCASVPVLGIITGAPIPPIELAAQGHLIPPGEAYHNHTSDVLTPPPDTLS